MRVGLFENQREANFESTVAMVEDVLIELGHFVNDCRIDSPEAPRTWRVRKGSAHASIALIEREDYWHLRVEAAVMTPAPRTDSRALFRRLLELNAHTVHGAAFALRGNHVVLVAERSTIDLDRSEVFDLVRRVRDFADHWDNALVAEFGGTLGAIDEP